MQKKKGERWLDKVSFSILKETTAKRLIEWKLPQRWSKAHGAEIVPFWSRLIACFPVGLLKATKASTALCAIIGFERAEQWHESWFKETWPEIFRSFRKQNNISINLQHHTIAGLWLPVDQMQFILSVGWHQNHVRLISFIKLRVITVTGIEKIGLGAEVNDVEKLLRLCKPNFQRPRFSPR